MARQQDAHEVDRRSIAVQPVACFSAKPMRSPRPVLTARARRRVLRFADMVPRGEVRSRHRTVTEQAVPGEAALLPPYGTKLSPLPPLKPGPERAVNVVLPAGVDGVDEPARHTCGLGQEPIRLLRQAARRFSCVFSGREREVQLAEQRHGAAPHFTMVCALPFARLALRREDVRTQGSRGRVQPQVPGAREVAAQREVARSRQVAGCLVAQVSRMRAVAPALAPTAGAEELNRHRRGEVQLQ